MHRFFQTVHFSTVIEPVYLMSEPNGISASLASLKHCNPNGIPTIVTQNKTPFNTDPSASGIPVTIIQMMFNKNEPAPPPYITSFPNGKKANAANLKHCFPIGIPIIVIHQRTPAIVHPSPIQSPPNKNHNRFPRHPMFKSPFCCISIWLL